MERPKISCVRLVAAGERGALPSVERLAVEHPTVDVVRAARAGANDAVIDIDAWLGSAQFTPFDEAVARSTSDAITVRGSLTAIGGVALEALTRWQRYIGRRNAESASLVFDAALRAHAALHDVSKPLVKADLDHAIDTWQWMLRLEPAAGLAAQLAALFHDIERLESEADARVEQHAPDYAAFKAKHAARGGERAEEVLACAGVSAATAARVRDIVVCHERRGRDAEVDLVNDADALSFFSLNSAGYADYFGPEQTRRKVAYTLARLSPNARERLAFVRLRPDVAAHLGAVEAA